MFHKAYLSNCLVNTHWIEQPLSPFLQPVRLYVQFKNLKKKQCKYNIMQKTQFKCIQNGLEYYSLLLIGEPRGKCFLFGGLLKLHGKVPFKQTC